MNKSAMSSAALFLFVLLKCSAGAAETDELKVKDEILYQQAASLFSELMKGATISRITPLKGGLSGAGVYKVVAGDQTYVLRILPESESSKAIKREFEISARMGELGISPRVYAFSYEKRAIIISAVEGGPIWGYQLTPEEIRDLGQKIRIIHETKLSDSGRPITPEELVHRIREDIKSESPEAYRRALDKHGANFKELEDNFALTHTDLNPGNLLKGSKGLQIIDWTDAAMTHPYLDLACVGIFYLHDSIDLEVFLSGYTNGKAQEINKEELNSAYNIYNLILSLRLLNTAKRLGSTLKKPTSNNMKEVREVVQQRRWKKMISMLSDKDKVYALSMVFLERSYLNLY